MSVGLGCLVRFSSRQSAINIECPVLLGILGTISEFEINQVCNRFQFVAVSIPIGVWVWDSSSCSFFFRCRGLFRFRGGSGGRFFRRPLLYFFFVELQPRTKDISRRELSFDLLPHTFFFIVSMSWSFFAVATCVYCVESNRIVCGVYFCMEKKEKKRKTDDGDNS